MIYLSVDKQDFNEVPEDEPDVVLRLFLATVENGEEDVVHSVEVNAVPEVNVVLVVRVLKLVHF